MGSPPKVINIHTIKPLDEELVVAAAKATGKLVTVEKHLIIGDLAEQFARHFLRKAPTGYCALV